MTSQQNNSLDGTGNRIAGSAGIVLCGGKSSRMGRSKADLPFGPETMLQRVVRLLSQVVNHIVVVAAADQVVPEFTSNVTIVRDADEYAGPLVALKAGLSGLQSCKDSSGEPYVAAYVTSCDVPFLNPRFVQELFGQIENYDVVVPFDEEHFHPISAVYRTSVLEPITQLIAKGQRRPRALYDLVRTRQVSTKSLEHADLGLLTLLNLNSPADYRAALIKAELPIPAWLDEG